MLFIHADQIDIAGSSKIGDGRGRCTGNDKCGVDLSVFQAVRLYAFRLSGFQAVRLSGCQAVRLSDPVAFKPSD